MQKLSIEELDDKYYSIKADDIKNVLSFINYAVESVIDYKSFIRVKYKILYRIENCIFVRDLSISNSGGEKEAHIRAILEHAYSNYIQVGMQYGDNRFFSIYKDLGLYRVFNIKYGPDVSKVLDELIENNKRMDLLR